MDEIIFLFSSIYIQMFIAFERCCGGSIISISVLMRH